MVCLQFAYQYCQNDFYIFTRKFFFVSAHGITYKKKLFYHHQPYKQNIFQIIRSYNYYSKANGLPIVDNKALHDVFKKYCAFLSKHKPIQVPANMLDCLSVYLRIKTE